MSEAKKMAIVVHSGTLDKLYPVLMLSSTGGRDGCRGSFVLHFLGVGCIEERWA